MTESPVIPPSRRSSTLLLVDGDVLLHAHVAEMLRPAGWTVVAARGAAEAQGVIERERPCAAMIDVGLPGERGDALCKRLRVDETWHDLPILMTSPGSQNEVIRRCLLSGADDFVAKPLQSHQLRRKLQAIQEGIQARPSVAPRGKEVLIATRSTFFATRLRHLLRSSGYASRWVQTPNSALEAVQGSPPPAVAILDLDLVGPDLIPQIRDRAAASLPLLGVSERTALYKMEAVTGLAGLYGIEEEFEGFVQHLSLSLAGSSARADRRKPRIRFHTLVEYRFYGDTGGTQAGFGSDLSVTGLFVRTLTPLPAKQPIEITFSLVEGELPLNAKGLVIWSNPFGPRDIFSYRYGMGIAFADFPVDEWTRLHQFVEKRLKGA